MSNSIKAFQIMTVKGRPVVNVPADWDEAQVVSFVQRGFGVQFNKRPHEVMPFTGDLSTFTAYTERVMGRIADKVKDDPLASKALLDVVDVAGIEIVSALDFYDMTAAELSQVYGQTYQSNAKTFHRALMEGRLWAELEQLRKRE